eukprot:2330220-Pyramimonas_sp.AAC.1
MPGSSRKAAGSLSYGPRTIGGTVPPFWPRFRFGGLSGRPSSPRMDSPRDPGQNAPRERSGGAAVWARVP